MSAVRIVCVVLIVAVLMYTTIVESKKNKYKSRFRKPNLRNRIVNRVINSKTHASDNRKKNDHAYNSNSKNHHAANRYPNVDSFGPFFPDIPCKVLVTGYSKAHSDRKCPHGANACRGNLTVCFNSCGGKSVDGSCRTYKSTSVAVTGGCMLDFIYAHADDHALKVEAPGAYVVSVRQDIVADEQVTVGEVSDDVTIHLEPDVASIPIGLSAINFGKHFSVSIESTLYSCSHFRKSETCMVRRPCIVL